ncbi:MAG: hypothetical protein R2795_14175 [Saprospiraceae bacterium]
MSHELDKRIREQLSHYTSEVDAEALWQAVRPPRKKRRGIVWWVLLGLLATGVVAYGGYRYTSQDSAPNIHPAAVVASEQYPAPPSSNVPATETNEAAQKPEVTTASPVASMQTSLSADTKASVSTTAASAKTVHATGAALAHKVQEIQRNPIATSDKEIQYSISPDNLLDPVAPTTTHKSTGGTTIVLPIPTLTFGLPSVANSLHAVTSPVGASTRKRHYPWFVQADAMYSLPKRTLTDRDTSFVEWIRHRKTTEEALDAWTVDLTAGYRTRAGWQFRAGLGYTRINTVFRSTLQTTAVDSVEGIQALVQVATSQVDTIYGLIGRRTITTTDKQHYNQFTQWEIPCWVGYGFEVGNLHLLAEVGARLRWQRQAAGIILSPDHQFIDLATTNWYATGWGLSFAGGLQAGLTLSPHLQLLAGVRAQYHSASFTTTDASFTEKYQLLGGHLGVRYNFR